jgi:hypothetical protein
MTRQPIESTSIASVGYDEATMTLEVEFKQKGAVWQYSPVARAVFEWMTDPTQSAGRIFHTNVKSNPAITATRVWTSSESAL